MVELHHVYVVLYAGAAVLSLVVTLVAWRHRAARGAVSVAALMLGVVIWSGGLAVMWYVPTLEQQTFWLRVTSLGTWVIPVGLLTLAFDIAGVERWRTPRRIALISLASFALNNLEWWNPGRLFDAGFVPRAVGPYTHFAVVPGPLYWAFVVSSYTAIVVAFLIIFRKYLRSSGTERAQTAVVLVGGLVPFVVGALTQFRAVPLDLDVVPLAFLVTGALWLTAILRGTLLDVLPLARGALVEQMTDGVVVLDGEDLVVDANPAALTMLHAPVADVLGKSAEAILQGVKGATALLADSGPRHAVLPIGSNGDSRYVELAITPLVVGRGRPPAQLVTLHDVTDEREANERLRLARQVFDTANEGIAVTLADGDGRIVDVNHAYCRLTGRSRDDAVGKQISFLRSDRHPPEFYKAMEETLFATGEWKGEVWQSRADGTTFPSWLSLSVTKDDQESARHIVRVFTDATEMREAEKLREASDAKSRFLANMSHELRTPLNSIIGFTGVMEQGLAGPLTDEQRTQLGMIHRSGKHLLRLVDDILDLERIEAGHASVAAALFDVRALANEVAAALAPQVEEKGIRLRVIASSEPLEIVSDRAKVEQVLINLAGNAVKFTESGEVTIACTADGAGVVVDVSDTGIGIQAKDIGPIMDDFHQVDRLDGMKPSGTGLGLSISRLLLGMLGGRLEIESEPGSGSTFRVWLPDLADDTGTGDA